MTACWALLLGLLSGRFLRRIHPLLILSVALIPLLLSLLLPGTTVADLAVKNQQRKILKELHGAFRSMESFSERLASEDLLDADGLKEVARRCRFKGWFTLYDPSGNPVAWNHHILDLSPSVTPEIRWTLDGWKVGRAVPVIGGGVVSLAIPQKRVRDSFGVDEVLYLPARQFAPLPSRGNRLESFFLWKEKDLPPFVQIHVKTRPYADLKRTFVFWVYGYVLFFLLGYACLFTRMRSPLAPILMRLLLIPVPWTLVGVRGWLADSTMLGINLAFPLFSTPIDILVTWLTLAVSLLILRRHAEQFPSWLRALFVFGGLTFVYFMSSVAVQNMGNHDRTYWLWILTTAIFIAALLRASHVSPLWNVSRSILWINVALFFLIILASLFLSWVWVGIVITLLLVLNLRSRLSVPLYVVGILVLTLLPFHLLLEGAWKGQVQESVARRTLNRSILQLAFLNGPVSSFFHRCDLTFLFPHAAYLDDWRKLAFRLADESGILSKGMLATINVYHEEGEVSTYANFPIPALPIDSSGDWQVREEEVFGDVRPVYHAQFPIFMEGRDWGEVAIRIMVNDPRIPFFVAPWRGEGGGESHFAVYGREGLAIFSGRGTCPRSGC